MATWPRVAAREMGSFQLRYIFRVNFIGNVNRLFSEIGVGRTRERGKNQRSC